MKDISCDGRVSLVMYDTVTNNHPEGININNKLVEKGLAKAGEAGSDDDNEEEDDDDNFGDIVDRELSSHKNSKTYVKRLEVEDDKKRSNVVHIVNHQGRAWLTSGDISSLILFSSGKRISTILMKAIIEDVLNFSLCFLFFRLFHQHQSLTCHFLQNITI